MDSNVGLAIQSVGIVLVTLLSLFMRSSIRNASLKYWTTAWACLSVALLSLFVAFHSGAERQALYSIYFLGEYTFGLMFVAGCHYHATAAHIARRYFYLLIPAAMLALALPRLSADFNNLFMIQATILASLFAGSLLALRPAWRRKEASPGLRVMCVALLLLTIDFLHDVPVFGARNGLWGLKVSATYLQYTSIFDLILEILLGFGTMMVSLEGVRREVEAVNRKLMLARDQLELMAQMDPLTEALNRHAFYSLVSRNGNDAESNISGCVAVIDIDNLKPINDSLGHSAGDKAIRAVAHAVRSLIRADDMLFRWGGDEFLVMMLNLSKAEAACRMRKLNEILEQKGSFWTSSAMMVSVSFGVSGFDSLRNLSHAIEDADKAMYRGRQQARNSNGTRMNFPPPGPATLNYSPRPPS